MGKISFSIGIGYILVAAISYVLLMDVEKNPMMIQTISGFMTVSPFIWLAAIITGIISIAIRKHKNWGIAGLSIGVILFIVYLFTYLGRDTW